VNPGLVSPFDSFCCAFLWCVWQFLQRNGVGPWPARVRRKEASLTPSLLVCTIFFFNVESPARTSTFSPLSCFLFAKLVFFMGTNSRSFESLSKFSVRGKPFRPLSVTHPRSPSLFLRRLNPFPHACSIVLLLFVIHFRYACLSNFFPC